MVSRSAARRVAVESHPGISAFQAASAAAGALVGHEFCCEVLDYGPGTARKFKPGTKVCSLPALLTAAEVLETHGCTSEGGQDSAALIRVEAAAMLKRMAARKVDAPRRGVIRAELPRFAALVGFCAVVLTVVYVGGPL